MKNNWQKIILVKEISVILPCYLGNNVIFLTSWYKLFKQLKNELRKNNERPGKKTPR